MDANELLQLLYSNPPVIVQGITSPVARHHTENMMAYGTRIVGGVRPGAGGQRVCGVEVFDRVEDVVRQRGAEVSILFVPARVAKEAALESIEAGIRLIVLVTEHIPLHDTLCILEEAWRRGVFVLGPNTPGLILPWVGFKLGFLPQMYFSKGGVAIASRSGTLTYEVAYRLNRRDIGQSIALGVGGDSVVGMPFKRILPIFEADPHTRVILLIGEVGGIGEEEAAEWIASGGGTKPVVAYLAGRSAPSGKRMGHAGALIFGKRGTIESKLRAFRGAGVMVADELRDIVPLVAGAL
ncbi:MAG: succinate--CoA ligase subunit alpha [Planctomycetota bacterium]|nr:MAG: succinate--CoA ligase subunit alpha [Planctomycetota bacterium]